jgi:DNA-binding IclR family transcriptional regulator
MAGAATVEKALDLLFHLHEVGAPLGLSEISRDLDLPKSSCHRLLVSLLDRDVVERDATGRYRPGLALLSLGLGAQAREPVVAAARPVLEAEALALGETVFLVARRRGMLRVLDKSEGTGFLRAAPQVGDVIPEAVTATGKLYRALAPDSGPPAEDAGDAEGFADTREGQAIARAGYATNRNEWIDGLSVLAVPIWQVTPGVPVELTATIALGAASGRFEAIGEAAIAARLMASAERVAHRLHVPPPSRGAESRARGAQA